MSRTFPRRTGSPASDVSKTTRSSIWGDSNIMLIFLSELGTKPSLGERGSRRACLYDSGSAGASPSRPIGAKLAPDCERYGRLCRVPDLRFTICQDLLAVSEYPTNVRERYRS